MSSMHPPRPVTRRFALGAGVAAALPLAGAAHAQPVTTVQGVETAADVAKAESEGAIVFYTHDSDAAGAAIAEAFTKDFPKIKCSYFRAQTGALFSKLLAERSAGRYNVDVVQFSDEAVAIDFQKRGGYQQYQSPQQSAYAAEELSEPPGSYFSAGALFAGIAYNTNLVKEADAPRTWKDLLDPRWRDTMSTKQATSGMQYAQWYELRRLYGDDYWKAFAKQRPRGFDSRAQLWDRLSKGDDKVTAVAEYAGYLLFKARGAPIAFVAPPDGLPAITVVAGVADKAPHPQAARLFLDWLASPRGQDLYQSNPYIYDASLRKDAAPMPDGKRLSDYKLLLPRDMQAYVASHDAFVREWNGMLGLL